MSKKEGKILRVSPKLFEALGRMREDEIKRSGLSKVSWMAVSEKAGKMLMRANERDVRFLDEVRKKGLRNLRL
jgi:hypothetical protein